MIVREDVIRSRANDLVKLFASLKDKKGREKNGLFIAEGEKLFSEMLAKNIPIEYVLVSEDYYKDKGDEVKNALSSTAYSSCRIIVLGQEAFEKISTEKAPQGIVTVAKYLDFFRRVYIINNEEFENDVSSRFLALMSVRDPGNLGAIIRSAAAFGVNHLLLSSDCADLYNPKTIRSAMGGLFSLKATVTDDFCSLIGAAHANGRRVYAAELREGAVSLADSDLKSGDIVVIGNEGHGIDPIFSSLCDGSIYIPICEGTESLNASVAASIFIYEQSKR